MINNIIFIFRLRSTYRANSIINVLRSIPLIKKLIPESAYDNRNLKTIAFILAVLMEVSSTFVGKILYFIVFLAIPTMFSEIELARDFSHLFIAGTIAGGLANSRFDNATRDSYYAVFFIRMPARYYALAELLIFSAKTFIGFYAFSIPAWLVFGVNPLIAAVIPVFVVCMKLISAPFMIWYGTRIESATGRSWILIGFALLIVALGLVTAILGFTLPPESLLYITGIAVVFAVISLLRLRKYEGFKQYYHKIFATDLVILSTQSAEMKKQALEKSYKKQITNAPNMTSTKTGFGYFNDLFIKRHRKVLMRVAKVITIIEIALLTTALVSVNFSQDLSMAFNDMLMNSLPYFLFIMYALNSGNRIGGSMFANCDEAMLNYSFYRTPKAILQNFTHRLRSVIAINLLPGVVVAVGLPLILFASGGTDDPLNYIVLFASIVSMSIFFSVHGMVLYYLLQPYNSKMELKNPIYSILNVLTYVVCYSAIGQNIPTLIFGIAMIAFCILYTLVALILVYRLAPRTFKLRR